MRNDLRPVLESIQAPTLLLHRRGAPRARRPSAIPRRVDPACALVELDGDDHEWFAGNTDRVLDEIRRVATAPFGQMVSLDLLLTSAYR
jgi:hypothetical protein